MPSVGKPGVDSRHAQGRTVPRPRTPKHRRRGPRLLDQGAQCPIEVGQLKAPVDYAQAGATTPAPSRKTRRQDMPGTETNGGVDRCLLRGTPGYWAGKSRPTSVVSAAFTVPSSPTRSAALLPSGRTWMRYSPTGRV